MKISYNYSTYFPGAENVTVLIASNKVKLSDIHAIVLKHFVILAFIYDEQNRKTSIKLLQMYLHFSSKRFLC